MLSPRSVRLLLLALCCLAWGAWATHVTGSDVPLALGASAALMQAWYTLRALLRKPARRGR